MRTFGTDGRTDRLTDFVGLEDDKTVGLLGALRIYIVSSNSKNIRKKLEMNLYVEIPI